MSEDLTQAKQDLLKNEIFEKGFDIDHFSGFMDTIKENGGSDIEVWTIEELQQAVTDYQIQQGLNGLEGLGDHAEEILPQNQIPQVMQQILSQNPNLEQDDNNFHKVINCRKSKVLQYQDTKIEVVSFEKKAGALFSASFVIYRIVTKPQNWEVSRRYNDFTWLRDTLAKCYPGICIPPIPKKSSTRNYHDQYLIKRMKFLEKFLNKILKSEDLQGDKYLEAFLSQVDEKEFKTIVKESEKIPKFTRLDLITNSQEKVTLNINGNINNFLRHSTEFLNNLEFYYKRVRKQSKQLMVDFDNVANTMYGLGDSFSQLHSISNHFNCNIVEGSNPQLEDMFINLNNLMVQWGNIISQQTKQISENFSQFFKFYHHEVIAQKENTKTRDQAANEFDRFKVRLDLKKDKLFQSAEIGRWEIQPHILQQLKRQDLMTNKKITMLLMLPRETAAQMDLRDIYGYYNNVAYEEFQRISHQNITEWANHYTEFVKSQSDQVTQLHILWADCLISLQCFGKQEYKPLQLMEGAVVTKQLES